MLPGWTLELLIPRGTWKGPFQPPSQQHLNQCLMSRFLSREAAGGFQDSGRRAGHPLCFTSVDILNNRCLHPHEPTAAMQLKTTSLLHLLCFAWAGQKLLQKGCNTERQVTHFLARCVVPERQDGPCFQVKSEKNPAQVPEGSFLFPFQFQRSTEKCRAFHSGCDAGEVRQTSRVSPPLFPFAAPPETRRAFLGQAKQTRAERQLKD